MSNTISEELSNPSWSTPISNGAAFPSLRYIEIPGQTLKSSHSVSCLKTNKIIHYLYLFRSKQSLRYCDNRFSLILYKQFYKRACIYSTLVRSLTMHCFPCLSRSHFDQIRTDQPRNISHDTNQHCTYHNSVLAYSNLLNRQAWNSELDFQTRILGSNRSICIF